MEISSPQATPGFLGLEPAALGGKYMGLWKLVASPMEVCNES